MLFDCLGQLERTPGQRYLYEAHRLCYSQVAEWYTPRFPLFRSCQIAHATHRTRRLEAAAVTGADALLCLTPDVQRALADNFPFTCPSLILPSGTAVPETEALGDAARDIDILYAGKLQRRKGVYDLVAAMAYLPHRRLCLVGGTPAEVEALKRFAAASGVAEQLTFAGYIPPAQVHNYYLRARVGVCPLPLGESTIAEQFTSPLKILDMMAWGVPIVATDLPSVRQILHHNRTALLVEPNNPHCLAQAVHTLLADRALAQRLVITARSEVERYSWQTRAERLYCFLSTLPW